MRLLVAIIALVFEATLSPRVYDKDVGHVSPTDRTPMMGFHWWQHASGDERLVAIGIAIQGLRAGWIFGSGATHVAVIVAFDDAYAKHKVSRDAIRIAGQPRPTAPPVFLKPLKEYRSKIDDAYARVPSMRTQDVAVVLLCFSDSKLITCRDEQGRNLR